MIPMINEREGDMTIERVLTELRIVIARQEVFYLGTAECDGEVLSDIDLAMQGKLNELRKEVGDGDD